MDVDVGVEVDVEVNVGIDMDNYVDGVNAVVDCLCGLALSLVLGVMLVQLYRKMWSLSFDVVVAVVRVSVFDSVGVFSWVVVWRSANA